MIELRPIRTRTPECGYSGGDGPGSRRKWRNGVVTAMVHELVEDAGVEIARTGKSILLSEGSPSMKLMACVLDCLDPRKRRRKTETALKRVARPKANNPEEDLQKIIRSSLLPHFASLRDPDCESKFREQV